VVAKPPAGRRRLQRSTLPALALATREGALDTVSKDQARMRKCGVCNGAGSFYPIDEGPLQECEVCNGSGTLKVKVFRKRTGRGGPRGTEVDPSTGDCSSRQLAKGGK
jgi:DnaJ-class molecular chaperone